MPGSLPTVGFLDLRIDEFPIFGDGPDEMPGVAVQLVGDGLHIEMLAQNGTRARGALAFHDFELGQGKQDATRRIWCIREGRNDACVNSENPFTESNAPFRSQTVRVGAVSGRLFETGRLLRRGRFRSTALKRVPAKGVSPAVENSADERGANEEVIAGKQNHKRNGIEEQEFDQPRPRPPAEHRCVSAGSW